MKKLLIGLLFVLAVVLAGCASPTTKDTTSPSPSPSPSPTVLTNADRLTQFLATVKPVRVRYRVIEKKMDHAIWDEAHKSADATWPKAGKKVRKLDGKYDGIMVDLQLIEAPDFMRPAMKSLLKGMRIERKMYDHIGDWMVNKENWGPGSSNGNLYEKLSGDAGEAFDAWRIKVKLEAKRYGVKIPWKWNKP